MENKKSDFKRFCETMWIMVKHDVLPWVVGAGIVGAVIIGVKDMEKKGKFPSEATKMSLFEKQR